MKVTGLKFGFKDKPIFSKVDMAFTKGLITGVVGKNGVGKTTFFRVLKGIYRPEEGEVVDHNGEEVKSQIAYLPTDPFFYPYMKGHEYLELVLGKQSDNLQIAELLELPLDDLVQEYSTGMKKKLAFAGLLGQDKPIMILDEPFSGVDLQSNVVLKKLLLSQKESKSIIVSSHTLESMMDLCDEIYYIEEGFRYRKYAKEDFEQIKARLSEQIDAKVAAFQQSLIKE